VNEVLLALYYSLPSDDDSAVNDLVRFFKILPISFHLWAVSLAVYSWTKGYWSCTGQKSRNQMGNIRRKLIALNIVISIVVFVAAVFYASGYRAEQNSAEYVEQAVQVIFAVLLLGVAIAFVAIAAEMVKHEQLSGGSDGRSIRNLRITEILIALCLVTLVVVSLTSVWAPTFYADWDAQLALCLKMSDIACYGIIVFLFTMTTAEERQQQRERRELNEKEKAGGAPPRTLNYLGVATRAAIASIVVFVVVLAKRAGMERQPEISGMAQKVNIAEVAVTIDLEAVEGGCSDNGTGIQ